MKVQSSKFARYLSAIGFFTVALPVLAQTTDFTMVFMPDTQFYTYKTSCSAHGGGVNDHTVNAKPGMLTWQTQWIRNNYPILNLPAGSVTIPPIVYAAQVGDMVDHGDCTPVKTDTGFGCGQTCNDQTTQPSDGDAEFQVMASAMSTLEGSLWVPYGVAVGNHDMKPWGGGPKPPNATATNDFNHYFGASHFNAKPFYGAAYPNSTTGNANNSHYDRLTVGGTDKYLIFYLEFDDKNDNHDPNLIPWVQSIMASNADRKAIIVTHSAATNDSPANFSGQGQRIYDALKTNANFFLMLGGHIPGSSRRQDRYTSGSTKSFVSTLMADYQNNYDGPAEAPIYNGGDGFMRAYTISYTDNAITAYTYSPYLDYTNDDGTSRTPQGITPVNTPAMSLDPNDAFQVQLNYVSRYDVFYRNYSDNSLYRIYWNGASWNAPQSLGGTMTSDPAATSRGATYLDVFYRGSNGNLTWVERTSGGFQAPVDLGIAISGTPSAAARGMYSMNVLYRSGNTLQQIVWNGVSWGSPTTLSVTDVASDPSMVASSPTTMDLVYRGTDGACKHLLYHLRDDTHLVAGWQAEENLGGSMVGNPTITAQAADRLDAFYQGTDNHLYHSYWNGTKWDNWTNEGQTLTSSPSAAAWGASDKRLDSFMREDASPTAKNHLFDVYWDGTAWNTLDLTTLVGGGALAGAPAVVSWSHFPLPTAN